MQLLLEDTKIFFPNSAHPQNICPGCPKENSEAVNGSQLIVNQFISEQRDKFSKTARNMTFLREKNKAKCLGFSPDTIMLG